VDWHDNEAAARSFEGRCITCASPDGKEQSKLCCWLRVLRCSIGAYTLQLAHVGAGVRVARKHIRTQGTHHHEALALVKDTAARPLDIP
jgi:hypothetical protein